VKILNPDPTAMSKLVTENASEEFLYSLSNYCGLQVILHVPQSNVMDA
jgi:methionine S-methyltransferase